MVLAEDTYLRVLKPTAMFGDLLGKLNDMQSRVKTVRDQLETVSVAGKSPDGKVLVVSNGNRKIQSVRIDAELQKGDPEELEDMLVLALNKALEEAERVNQKALSDATGDLLPPHLMNMLNKQSS